MAYGPKDLTILTFSNYRVVQNSASKRLIHINTVNDTDIDTDTEIDANSETNTYNHWPFTLKIAMIFISSSKFFKFRVESDKFEVVTAYDVFKVVICQEVLLLLSIALLRFFG